MKLQPNGTYLNLKLAKQPRNPRKNTEMIQDYSVFFRVLPCSSVDSVAIYLFLYERYALMYVSYVLQPIWQYNEY